MSNSLNILSFPLGPFATNCYIAWHDDSDECWIIDASFGPQQMFEAIEQNKLRPSKLILTHAHLDHIGGVEDFRAKYPGLPVYIHEAESQWLVDPVLNLSSTFGLPVTAKPAEHLLTESDSLSLQGLDFSILHTPGHSPGSICLYSQQSQTLFAGDTLFFDSIGRTDFANADHGTLIKSINEKIMVLPDATRVLPGHMDETTIGRERKHNPFLR